ncbi:MAG TPA: TonB-dependent receptor [Candidatus Binatia bacterium]|nr:TonB-dependent receptor [Candidatus Binatia bacterium]
MPALAQEAPGAPPEPATISTPAGDSAAADSAKAAQDAEAQAVTLDTIEVYALRRKERLLDVPVAVTAMTRDQIESRGIQRLDDLNSLAPGLQVSRSPANTTISQITIRGSSQINPAIYWDPAVGVYVDGVYIGKAQGSIFNVVDLAGVEVLRGPQGTLYGRNTIGGTINFLTREPSGYFSGSAALEFGNLNARVQRASIDLPRIGFADITLGVRSERRDGWVQASPDSPVDELNNRHNDGLHFAALMDLLPELQGLYRFDYGKIDQTNNYLQLYRSDDATLQRYVHKDRQTQADIDAESFEHSKVQGHSLTLTWNLDERTALKAITGYRKVRWEDSLDLDGSPMFVAFTQRFTDYKQLSQDLNLGGSLDAWKYVAGVYYFADDGFTNNPQHFDNGALNFDSRYGTHTRAWAGYGQADWEAMERLTLTGGLRYTREEKSLDRVIGASPLPGAVPGLPLPGGGFVYYIREGWPPPKASFTATTPMVSAAWKFNDQLNTYLRYAEGFKSGGFNGEYSNLQDTPDDGNPATSNDTQRATATPFRPERQKSLELGLKSSFFGGRGSLNLAAFRNKLVDLQVSTFSGQGAAASTISNAGKATVRGIEVESAVVPFEGTTLRANYAWLDAKYDEFLDKANDPNDPTGQADTFQNLADNRAFVHAPRHSYNVVLDSRLVEGHWGELRAVADYVWTAAFYTYPYQLKPDPDPLPTDKQQEAEDTKVQAHGLLNARLAWSQIPLGGTSTLELALWGRNLMDDATANNFIDFGPGAFQSLTTANFEEPRTYGIAGVLRW